MTTCNERTIKQGDSCEEVIVNNEDPCGGPPAYAPFSFCHMGATYKYDGVGFVRVGEPIQVEDGVYTSIAIEDGCIVGFGEAPLPVITPPPCVSSPCGGCSTCGQESAPVATPQIASATGIGIDPAPNNLLAEGLNGHSAKLYMKTSQTVNITGNGTSRYPLHLEVKDGDQLGVVSGAGIEVTDTAAGYNIALKKVMTPGFYSGFDVNSYGQVIGFTEKTDDDVVRRLERIGSISIAALGSGAYRIGIDTTGVMAKNILVGGYSMAITDDGVIASATRSVTVPEFQSKFIDYSSGTPTYRAVAVNEYGSIVDTLSDEPAPEFMETLPDVMARDYTFTVPVDPYLVIDPNDPAATITVSKVRLTVNRQGITTVEELGSV